MFKNKKLFIIIFFLLFITGCLSRSDNKNIESIFLSTGVLAANFTIALYHFILYFFRRKSKYTLFFGFFCFFMSIGSVMMDYKNLYLPPLGINKVLSLLLQQVGMQNYLVLMHFVIALACISILTYLRELFPQDVNKYVYRFFTGAYCLIASFVILTFLNLSPIIHSIYIMISLLVSLSFIIHLIFLVILILYRKRSERFYLFWGIMIFNVTAINDIFNGLKIISTLSLMKFGSFFWILSQAALIAKRFSLSFENIETLSVKLEDYSKNLEKKVQERTIKLEEAKKKIEKANQELMKLDALKNDFIANITHDFRSPLTVILNTADIAIRYNKSISNDLKSNFTVIYKSSLRLKNTIDRLLELAKIDSSGLNLKIKNTRIVTHLNTLIDYYKSAVSNSKIKIVKILPEHEVDNFYTDIGKLEEILENIISNAIKFVDVRSGVITVELVEEASNITIIITDNGIGIPEDKLNKIFDRFEQLHEGRNSAYRGTGIGLAFSKQLAGYLKAELWAESAGKNKGSKFFIKLKKGKQHFNYIDDSNENNPIKIKKDIKSLVEIELEDKIQNKTFTIIFNDLNKENEMDYKKGIILIIDDDKAIREIVLKYLENNGFKNFIVASDGKQGLDAIYKYSPDIILCDLNMPDMRGDEMHDHLIKDSGYKEIPFVFLSAIADEELMLEMRETGAVAYLKKPIEKRILLLTVEEQLKRYFQLKKMQKKETGN